MTPKCTACHDTGELLTLARQYGGWRVGWMNGYEWTRCGCTPRGDAVRPVREYPPRCGGGRRAAVKCEPTKGNQDGNK